MKKFSLFAFFALLLLGSSCVSKKKFLRAEWAATVSKDSLQGLLNDSRHTNAQMSSQVTHLLNDTTQMGNRIRHAERTGAALAQQCKRCAAGIQLRGTDGA